MIFFSRRRRRRVWRAWGNREWNEIAFWFIRLRCEAMPRSFTIAIRNKNNSAARAAGDLSPIRFGTSHLLPISLAGRRSFFLCAFYFYDPLPLGGSHRCAALMRREENASRKWSQMHKWWRRRGNNIACISMYLRPTEVTLTRWPPCSFPSIVRESNWFDQLTIE